MAGAASKQEAATMSGVAAEVMEMGEAAPVQDNLAIAGPLPRWWNLPSCSWGRVLVVIFSLLHLAMVMGVMDCLAEVARNLSQPQHSMSTRAFK